MLRSPAFALVLVLAPVAVAPAVAAAPTPTEQQRPSVTVHYRTLEKMLRRFSRMAGEARIESRTRG